MLACWEGVKSIFFPFVVLLAVTSCWDFGLDRQQEGQTEVDKQIFPEFTLFCIGSVRGERERKREKLEKDWEELFFFEIIFTSFRKQPGGDPNFVSKLERGMINQKKNTGGMFKNNNSLGGLRRME